MARKDRLWVGRLQPYIKNGGDIGPTGMFKCPSFSESRLQDGANQPDCYPGEFSGLLPATEWWSNYGIVFQEQNAEGAGTPQDPLQHFPGSVIDCNAGGANPCINSLCRFLPEIVRPAETVITGDGTTFVGGGFIVVSIGCESQKMHQEGANFTFLDGHAKFIARNPERYIQQRRSDGKWFKKYFGFSME